MIDFSEVPNTEIIAAVMNEILDSIVGVFEFNDVLLPERRFITVGGTVHDCEQLTVSFDQLIAGPPGAQTEEVTRCNDPRTIALTIELVRCIPVARGRGSAVSAADLSDAATRMTGDAWLLMEGAMASGSADYLGALTDVSVTEPSGGFQATVLNMVVGVP